MRLIRSRTIWDSDKLARKLDADVELTEVLLELAGFDYDEVDDLWKRQEGGDKELRALLGDAICAMLEHLPPDEPPSGPTRSTRLE